MFRLGHDRPFPHSARRSRAGLRVNRQAGQGGGIVVEANDPETGQALVFDGAEPFSYTTQDAGGAVAAVPANSSLSLNLRIRNDSGFLLTSIRGVATSLTGLTVRIVDEAQGREWMDRPINASLLVGTARDPYVLPTPTLLPPNSVLSVHLADSSGAQNDVALAFEGVKLHAPGAGQRDFVKWASESVFWYGATLSLGAGVGTRGNVTIPMQAGSDFELRELQSDVRSNWDAMIRTESGGAYMLNAPTRADLLFGESQRPGALGAPKRLPALEDLTLEGINAQAGAQTVNLALGGAKLWRR